jgi:hypothetical protein
LLAKPYALSLEPLPGGCGLAAPALPLVGLAAHAALGRGAIDEVLGSADEALTRSRHIGKGRLPFPYGTIIAALHHRHVSSENDRAFGRSRSFIAGPPTNVQFMVKDSKKYASTGGWGFGHFQGGKLGDEAMMKSCFPRHQQMRPRDLVFTRYAPAPQDAGSK